MEAVLLGIVKVFLGLWYFGGPIGAIVLVISLLVYPPLAVGLWRAFWLIVFVLFFGGLALFVVFMVAKFAAAAFGG